MAGFANLRQMTLAVYTLLLSLIVKTFLTYQQATRIRSESVKNNEEDTSEKKFA
jgi:hypothetical protein